LNANHFLGLSQLLHENRFYLNSPQDRRPGEALSGEWRRARIFRYWKDRSGASAPHLHFKGFSGVGRSTKAVQNHPPAQEDFMRLFRSARWLMLALLLPILSVSQARAGVFISVGIAPPVLPIYEQPPCPQPGLMWSPGYWAYDQDNGGYYWVPGTWVPAPYVGAYWTPPYWGFESGAYIFHGGYWGPHVGYYGGVNYGFGYMGIGFAGGEWRGHDFAYNTAVVRVNETVIHNTYINKTVVVQNTVVNNNRVAYSGGPNGIRHEPTPQEQAAMHEQHQQPTQYQQQHIQSARTDKTNFYNNNHGRPQQLAVAKPLPAAHYNPPPSVANANAHGNVNARPGEVNGKTNGNANAHPGTVASPNPRPAPQPARPEQQQKPETRPAPQSQPQARPEPRQEPRPETRPAPQSQPRPESHPAPQPQPRPAQPQSRPESHPAPQPQSRPESHPAPQPQSHPQPQPRPESHPAPQPHPQSKPAPQEHPNSHPKEPQR
jgi:WXXGXW repeat (2 copies)